VWNSGTYYGFFEADTVAIVWHFPEQLGQVSIPILAFENTGKLWIGSSNGLFRYNGSTYQPFPTTSAPPIGQVSCLDIDKQGDKWVGGDKGLARLSGEQWTAYTKENSGLPDNKINCVEIDKKNKKWFGTENGLAKFDGSTWRVFTLKNSKLPGRYIYDLAIDSSNSVWMKTAWVDQYSSKGIGEIGNLVKFDGVQWQKYETKGDLATSSEVTKIEVAPNGHVWVSLRKHRMLWTTEETIYEERRKNHGNNYLLSEFNGKRWINHDIPSKPLFCFREIDTHYESAYKSITFRKKSIWVGNSANVNQLDLAKYQWLTLYSQNTDLSSGYEVVLAPNGELWISTGYAFDVWRDTGLVQYKDVPAGMPGGVFDLHFDSTGNMWVGTDYGIGMLSGSISTFKKYGIEKTREGYRHRRKRANSDN
jgi:ligand-binding sensor domain-containing protein